MKQILVGIQDLLDQPNPADPAQTEGYQLFIQVFFHNKIREIFDSFYLFSNIFKEYIQQESNLAFAGKYGVQENGAAAGQAIPTSRLVSSLISYCNYVRRLLWVVQ